MAQHLITDGTTTIELDPDHGLRRGEAVQRKQTFTQGGEHHVYDLGAHLTTTIPLSHVSSSDAFTMNNWWMNRTAIEYTYNSSASAWLLGRITNPDQPLVQHQEPYRDRYQGGLMIEATQPGSYQPWAFILDHDEFGLLDTNPQRLG